MTLQKMKPITPGTRGRIAVRQDGIYKGRPFKPLTSPKISISGRNNRGVITVRHRGGRGRLLYRHVDFFRKESDVPAVVERLEYDPNRTAYIALLKHANGARSYVIAQEGLKPGDELISHATDNWKVGYAMKLSEIPLGSVISCLELRPNEGAKIARGAGTYCRLVAKDSDYATVRLKSGEVRKFKLNCRATIGAVSGGERALQSDGKAGIKRRKGIRPTVRGVAMNPIDHPHGGGNGKTSGGRHPVSPWGMPTKGYKTRRKNRPSNVWIVSRRK